MAFEVADPKGDGAVVHSRSVVKGLASNPTVDLPVPASAQLSGFGHVRGDGFAFRKHKSV